MTSGTARARTTPVPPVGAGWLITFVLAMTGVAAGWFGPLQILLPAQAEAFEAAGAGSKEAALALVSGTGALVSLIANPLWGVLSDRLRSSRGPRVPVILAGTAIGVLGLLILATAPSVGWMVTGWACAQLGLNGPAAAYAALIADRVPPSQRGLVGALFGIAQTLGVVTGTALAVASDSSGAGYVALAIAVPALGAGWLLAQGRQSGDFGTALPPRVAARRLRGGLPPLFAWAWGMRFLMNFGNALVLLYLYFYLDDAVGVEDTETAVLLVTVLVVLIAAATAGVAGGLSDRLRRRRAFAVAAAVATVAGTVTLAALPPYPVVIGAASALGCGWGLYLAVDMALVTATLTDPTTHATMLGIANIAAVLPQVAAPLVAAALVAGPLGYSGLYGLAALTAAAAVLCVARLPDRY
ncbi:MFS transporter [Nocardia barduliensis]|uniref:MFS transporter n=1 Tax=Nocardia barduliensis TaxID=2736643 RepID=UPI001574B205|nr:MFS transporter [Nocardia barduliensis]